MHFLRIIFCFVGLIVGLNSYAGSLQDLVEILDPVSPANCELALSSSKTNLSLPTSELQKLVDVLHHHGRHFGLGLGPGGPKEKKPVYPPEIVLLFQKFQKAVNSRRQTNHLVNFELEPHFVTASNNGQYVFEHTVSTDLKVMVLIQANEENLDTPNPGRVRMMVVFMDLRNGMRAEFEQIFRGLNSHIQIGRAKSNPILDTGWGYNFRGADQSTYFDKKGEKKPANISAHIQVSNSFPQKPLKLSFKVYLVR